MECDICGDKHSFDKCTILNDIPYLQKHFIAYYLQWKRTQKQMITITAVNRTQAAALEADGTDDHDIVLDDSDSNTATDDNDDDNQEFFKEGE